MPRFQDNAAHKYRSSRIPMPQLLQPYGTVCHVHCPFRFIICFAGVNIVLCITLRYSYYSTFKVFFKYSSNLLYLLLVFGTNPLPEILIPTIFGLLPDSLFLPPKSKSKGFWFLSSFRTTYFPYSYASHPAILSLIHRRTSSICSLRSSAAPDPHI